MTRKQQKPKNSKRNGFRPHLEWLENRTVPSAMLDQEGVLHIFGSEAGDSMRLSPGPNQGDVALFGVPDVQDGAIFQKVRAVRLDALAGDDLVKIEALTLLEDAQLPDQPCVDVGGGAGSDIIDISVLVGAEGGWANDITVNAGEGQNETFIRWANAFLGTPPKTNPTIHTRYISGDGDDRFGLRYEGRLEVTFDLQADTGGGDDDVHVGIVPAGQGGQPAPPPSDNPQEPIQPPPLPAPDGIYNVLLSTDTGRDDVTVNASLPVGPCEVVWNTGIDLGADADRLAFDVFSRAESLTMNTAIQAGAGADIVDIVGARTPTPNAIVWNANIDLGAGADRLALDIFSAAESLTMNTTVQGGTGADDVSMKGDFSIPDGPCEIVWNTGIDLGADADRLALNIFSRAESLTMNTAVEGGTGDDDVSVNVGIFCGPLCSFAWNFAIDLGNGSDVLMFNLFSEAEAVDLNVNIQGDNGADRLSARVDVSSHKQGKLAVLLAGGNGDDYLELGIFCGAQCDDLFALLDGGKGFDTARATGNVLVKNVEQFTQ